MDFIKTQDNLYELRLGGDRIFFCCVDETTFVLLHGFVKKRRKHRLKKLNAPVVNETT
ncbi:MAG: type II toxin-antitoxin system RelE/ParE family toxin [Clostridia bacterium]|nr:type II toxin-antitoxin system RelE/ParE family toxin [Clostridia bacterium]